MVAGRCIWLYGSYSTVALGDVRGNVMKWELDHADDDAEVVMDHVATLGDAVRGLHMDRWSLTAVAYDGSCNVWDFWN